MMRKSSAPAVMPLFSEPDRPTNRWFAPYACVTEGKGSFEVFVDGLLIGRFGATERGVRNAILVQLAEDPQVNLGQLASAFGVSDETLRLIRQQYAAEGLAAVIERRPGGHAWKVTPARRRHLEKLFDKGLSVSQVHDKVEKRYQMSRATVGAVRQAWAAARKRDPSLNCGEAPRSRAAAVQMSLPSTTHAGQGPGPTTGGPPAGEAQPSATAVLEPSPALTMQTAKEEPTATFVEPPPSSVAATEMSSSPTAAPASQGEAFDARDMHSARHVQHLGLWLLLGIVHRLGLYRRAEAQARAAELTATDVRLAVDAFAGALAIGQKCVEGVRRLATPTAPLLFRSPRVPSEDRVRWVFHKIADAGAAVPLQAGMAGDYIRAARERSLDDLAVFYVDNHLRRYQGQFVLRKGWRMQDKRAVPGTTDYYIHDEDGRPVLRVNVPWHASITDFLAPIARMLRMALGDDQRILIAFDRGGAYPSQMAELRDENFEFATYERAPYQLLPRTAFDQEVTFAEDGEAETLQFTEGRANLGSGRGRVRRVAVRMPDGNQVNVLAISQAGAERLIQIMRGRWGCQENALKYGVERWGVNQLDGRRVEHYTPDTIIPNPARRRLERALKLAYAREGEARRKLARCGRKDPGREEAKRDLAAALTAQEKLLALRPSTPKHASLRETELADDLVYHPSQYKSILDTVRITCANAEADLATRLAPHLAVPQEAKKTLANLFASPGDVKVGARSILVRLTPAGTLPEYMAFKRMLAEVNALKLTLPGEPRRRRLRFELQS